MTASELIRELVEAGLASPHNLMPGLMQAGHSEADAARLARHLAAELRLSQED
jgi:hypothetical protein